MASQFIGTTFSGEPAFGYGYYIGVLPNILNTSFFLPIPTPILKEKILYFQTGDWKNNCESYFHRSNQYAVVVE